MGKSNLYRMSQKLLYCTIVGKDFNKSKRFVELENFNLWAYMMFHKHGLRIQDISLWLWVHEKEYLEQKQVEMKAPVLLEVSKLGVFLFDELNDFNHLNYRYAENDQVSTTKKILMSHVSPDLMASGNCDVTVEKGYCIKSDIKNLGKMVLGLSGHGAGLCHREE